MMCDIVSNHMGRIMEIELPYIRVDDPGDFDSRCITQYDIRPVDEDKRIRVFGNQLLNSIVEDTTLSNFDFNIRFFYKQRFMLEKRFSHRSSELARYCAEFWLKMHKKRELLEEQEKINPQNIVV